jgi:beta-phosphoglucomutase family hydrolase
LSLGLPDAIRACLFDMDGVLTRTETVHATAWKQMFDEYLQERARRSGETFRPFDKVHDYDAYVDGKPREEGVRSFLRSRSIELPDGGPDDPPDAETIHALGQRKNEIVLRLIHDAGVRVYDDTIRYLDAVQAAGLACAVVSSSTNTHDVLRAAGLADRFDTVIDGVVAHQEHLQGKPAPDTFLAAARALHVPSAEAAVFEDAVAGVAAGHAGHFGVVIGVDRAGQADELRAHGADIVVSDVTELLTRS